MTSIESKRLSWPSKPSKIVVIGMGLFFLVAMIVIVVNQFRQNAADRPIPITDFPPALKDEELESLAPLETPDAIKVDCKKIYEVSIGGQPVWVVYFDPFDAKQEKARNALQRSGAVEARRERHSAKVRGNVALVGYENHPDRDKILAAFKTFATPRPVPPAK